MKVRMGFVSNSSSSSFLLINSKQTYEAAVAVFGEQEHELFNIIARVLIEWSKFLGRDVAILSYMKGEAGDEAWIEGVLRQDVKALQDKLGIPKADILSMMWDTVYAYEQFVIQNKHDHIIHTEHF